VVRVVTEAVEVYLSASNGCRSGTCVKKKRCAYQRPFAPTAGPVASHRKFTATTSRLEVRWY
jgi:hypothetical protein